MTHSAFATVASITVDDLIARIYLKLPQCLQWNFCQERPNSRQIAVLSTGILFLIILTIFIIQSRSSKSDSYKSYRHPAIGHPTIGEKLDKTLFSYGPNVHYGIVLDCGSSGTRVYVYIWPPHSGNPRDLLNIQQLKDQDNQPVVKKVSPGTYHVILTFFFKLENKISRN